MENGKVWVTEWLPGYHDLNGVYSTKEKAVNSIHSELERLGIPITGEEDYDNWGNVDYKDSSGLPFYVTYSEYEIE